MKTRTVKPCRCRYQSEEGDPAGKPWGYLPFVWLAKSPFWKRLTPRRVTLETAEKKCRPHPHVLISCAGCGADVVREYGPQKS